MPSSQFVAKALKHIQSADATSSFLSENGTQNINERDEHGDALVHFAARNHSVDVLQVLHNHGADFGAVNEHGRQPLHEAIDSAECVEYIVDHCHVDVNALKRGDWTPVMSAALKGRIDIIQILEKAGAQLDRVTKDGRTPLHLAIQHGHLDAAKYLAEHAPQSILKPTKSGRLPAQIAAATVCEDNDSNNGEEAKNMTLFLLSHVPSPGAILRHRDKSGRGLLQDAAVAQNLDLLKCLIRDYNADPNDTDSLGRGIIHHAAMMGNVRVLEMVESMQLDGLVWDTPDGWDQWTPLMHASRQGHVDVVRFLVEHRLANIRKQDKQGRTAQEIAAIWNHHAICEILSRYHEPPV